MNLATHIIMPEPKISLVPTANVRFRDHQGSTESSGRGSRKLWWLEQRRKEPSRGKFSSPSTSIREKIFQTSLNRRVRTKIRRSVNGLGFVIRSTAGCVGSSR